MCDSSAFSLEVEYNFYWPGADGPMVSVSLGDTLIAALVPCRVNKAGHGDDSSYFKREEQDIAEETVAPYLRKLFDV